MPGDKKPRDPITEHLIMQYVRTFLLFLALMVIAYAIKNIGQ